MHTVSPIAFTLCGISVHWYGIMIAAGVLCAVMIASLREKRLELPKDTALNIILCALPAAIVCARLYYVAFSWPYYSTHPSEIFAIRNGGLAIYGGLIGGILTGFVYARIKKISVAGIADLAAPAIAVGQAFGRWGNFFNQEAYGAPVLNEALHFFPVSVFIDSQGGWFFATFFYESIWCLLLCVALLIFEKRRTFARPGDMMLWYVLAYAVERVAVEGLRTDSLYAGGIRISQLLSAVLLVSAASILICRLKDKRFILLTLPSLLLTGCTLLGIQIGFAGSAVLALLQLSLSLYSYYIIRKKASLP